MDQYRHQLQTALAYANPTAILLAHTGGHFNRTGAFIGRMTSVRSNESSAGQDHAPSGALAKRETAAFDRYLNASRDGAWLSMARIHPKFDSCSVVGSGGSPIGAGNGAAIDAHQVVIRYGAAPTGGVFIADAGNRTTLRLCPSHDMTRAAEQRRWCQAMPGENSTVVLYCHGSTLTVCQGSALLNHSLLLSPTLATEAGTRLQLALTSCNSHDECMALHSSARRHQHEPRSTWCHRLASLACFSRPKCAAAHPSSASPTSAFSDPRHPSGNSPLQSRRSLRCPARWVAEVPLRRRGVHRDGLEQVVIYPVTG